MMTEQEHFALKQLIKFHFFTSLAISLAASWGVTDLLMLKMDFDLARFGVVKGNMFLVPALTYFLVSGKMGKLGHEIRICQWSYFLRTALPIVLPFLALAGMNREALLWITAGIMAVGYTCAMFANNTLLKVMRSTLPPDQLNKQAVFLTCLLGLPGSLLCIPVTWFLTRIGDDPKVFLSWFAALQIAVTLFEYPAIRAIGKIKMPPPPETQKTVTFPFRSILKTELLMLFGLTLLHGFWMGLSATYFVVYLLKNYQLAPSSVLWIEAGLGAVALWAGPQFGKLVDRWGYALSLTACTALMSLTSLLWASNQNVTWIFFLFTLLVYNGNGGFLAGMLRQSECIASVRLPKPDVAEFSVGVGSLLFAIGSFSGCISAGKLYTALNGSLEQYFRWCAWGPVLIFTLSVTWYFLTRCTARKE